MKKFVIFLSSLLILAGFGAEAQQKTHAGNPVFPGWYSDPEGVIWEGRYWIFPTASLPFEEQTYMDAFSSPDLVNWTKHERMVDTTEVKWIWQAMWSPAVIRKDGYYYLFICGNDMYHDGAGHHSVVHEPKSGKWYIFYHRHPLGSTDGNHRVVCIDEMFFDENGYIKPVKMTFEGVEANPLQGENPTKR